VRCLITGATGFIGSHLAHALADERWNVHAVLRASSDASILTRNENPITLHYHDGTLDGINEIMQRAKPDVVFHLAAFVQAKQHQPKDVGPLIESNILFGSYLLEAMRLQSVTKLINTATAAQHYGQQDYSPTCLYAATKQAFEDILTYYTQVHGLQAITLTLFDTYGPRDRRKKLLQLLQEAAATRRPLVLTPGEQMIDLVHVDDVVRGYMVAADLLLHGKVTGSPKFMLSSGRPIKIRELVNCFERITGSSLIVHWGGIPYQVREVMVPWNRGIPLPGWEPRISLEEGLKNLDKIEKRCSDAPD